MKLKINKACDLNSISVLPPHTRRSNIMQQPRSQPSQQSFSQGISSQQNGIISQSSIDDVLTDNQRFGSQEKDNSVKRLSCLGPMSYPREESQMPISISSSSLTRRWSSATASEHKCQLNDELEHKITMMETSLNRSGMILDSVQADIMQVNKGTKELSLEVESLRQKSIAHQDSLHLLNRAQEETRASLESISNQLCTITQQDKIQEILLAVLSLREHINTNNQKQTDELSKHLSGDLQNRENFSHLLFDMLESIRQKSIAHQDSLHLLNRAQEETRASLESISNQLRTIMQQDKIQEILLAVLSLREHINTNNQKQTDELSKRLSGDLQEIMCSLKTLNPNNMPLSILPPKVTGARPASSSSQKPFMMRKAGQSTKVSKQAHIVPKTEVGSWTTVKAEKTAFSNRCEKSCKNPKQKRASLDREQKVFIKLDETDDDLSCLIIEKKTGEMEEDTAEILRKARRRKRKQNCKRLFVAHRN